MLVDAFDVCVRKLEEEEDIWKDPVEPMLVEVSSVPEDREGVAGFALCWMLEIPEPYVASESLL